MNIDWEWIGTHFDDMWTATTEHLALTLLAVGVGLVVAMALSLVALRWRNAYAPITWFNGIL